MKNGFLRLLTLNDTNELLDFELTNRGWFEQLIAPRSEAFYNLQGVDTHIKECLRLLSEGKMYPAIVLNSDGKITGRINLHHIEHSKSQAEVGYRIAQNAIGKGLASFVVEQIIAIAFKQLNLQKLNANVLDNNPASKRIMQKFGFELISEISDPIFVKSNPLLGNKWQLNKIEWNARNS